MSHDRQRLRANDKRHYYRNIASERMRSRRRNWKKWGIDPEAAQAALDAHDGKCEICRTTKPGGRGNWHVDHNHETKKIRGILCLRCNAGIGQLNDDPRVLVRATMYLQGLL